MIEAYPLQWPVGYRRTPYRSNALFKTSLDEARKGMFEEIRRMDGKNIVISTNLPLTDRGLPNGNFRHSISDPGVAVYFTYENEQVVFACDKWNEVRDNMQAIRKAIEALRGLDRWGVSDLLKRAFAGFKTLPENSTETFWDILGIQPTKNRETITSAYRKKAFEVHPDKGGSSEMFQRVKWANDQALKFAGA